jgi:hypothetical protein
MTSTKIQRNEGDSDIPVNPFIQSEASSQIKTVHTSTNTADTVSSAALDENLPNQTTIEASLPTLSPPAEDVAAASQGSVIRESNPWFQVSFLSAFMSIMRELLHQEKNTRFLEAQTERKARSSMIEISKSNAVLTVALYRYQAMEKMAEAFTAFVTAGISMVDLAQKASNLNKATKEVQTEIDNKQKEVTRLETRTGIGSHEPISEEKMQSIEGRDLKAERDALAGLKANKQAHIQQKYTVFTQETASQSEIQKQIVNGITNTVISSFKSVEGQKDAAKQLNDGYNQIMNRYMESASRGREDAKSSYDKNVDLMRNTQESNIRTNTLGGA